MIPIKQKLIPGLTQKEKADFYEHNNTHWNKSLVQPIEANKGCQIIEDKCVANDIWYRRWSLTFLTVSLNNIQLITSFIFPHRLQTSKAFPLTHNRL